MASCERRHAQSLPLLSDVQRSFFTSSCSFFPSLLDIQASGFGLLRMRTQHQRQELKAGQRHILGLARFIRGDVGSSEDGPKDCAFMKQYTCTKPVCWETSAGSVLPNMIAPACVCVCRSQVDISSSSEGASPRSDLLGCSLLHACYHDCTKTHAGAPLRRRSPTRPASWRCGTSSRVGSGALSPRQAWRPSRAPWPENPQTVAKRHAAARRQKAAQRRLHAQKAAHQPRCVWWAARPREK